MGIAYYINILGLICELIGVIFLFIYGGRADLNRMLKKREIDNETLIAGQKFIHRTNAGLILIIIAFVLQSLSSALQGMSTSVDVFPRHSHHKCDHNTTYKKCYCH